jgi:hypothetical protein
MRVGQPFRQAPRGAGRASRGATMVGLLHREPCSGQWRAFLPCVAALDENQRQLLREALAATVVAAGSPAP